MSVAVQDFLDYAQSIVEDKDTVEIAHRFAISRAYYAAYHHCDFWNSQLSAQGDAGSAGSGVHATLIRRLQNPIGSPTHPTCASAKKTSVQKGACLAALKKEREIADYDLNAVVAIVHADRAIAKAKVLIAL